MATPLRNEATRCDGAPAYPAGQGRAGTQCHWAHSASPLVRVVDRTGNATKRITESDQPRDPPQGSSHLYSDPWDGEPLVRKLPVPPSRHLQPERTYRSPIGRASTQEQPVAILLRLEKNDSFSPSRKERERPAAPELQCLGGRGTRSSACKRLQTCSRECRTTQISAMLISTRATGWGSSHAEDLVPQPGYQHQRDRVL